MHQRTYSISFQNGSQSSNLKPYDDLLISDRPLLHLCITANLIIDTFVLMSFIALSHQELSSLNHESILADLSQKLHNTLLFQSRVKSKPCGFQVSTCSTLFISTTSAQLVNFLLAYTSPTMLTTPEFFQLDYFPTKHLCICPFFVKQHLLELLFSLLNIPLAVWPSLSSCLKYSVRILYLIVSIYLHYIFT